MSLMLLQNIDLRFSQFFNQMITQICFKSDKYDFLVAEIDLFWNSIKCVQWFCRRIRKTTKKNISGSYLN